MNITHKAHIVTEIGEVSPLCAIVPRALDDEECWTHTNALVTCPDCRQEIRLIHTHMTIVLLAVVAIAIAYFCS
jgi:hypothetical protein